ncbi:hypothetical protein BDW75DRAFT_246366 [Aspergillus navahoensis]
MALKNRVMPPNLHFQNLSSKVIPFFDHLDIPTTAIPWEVADGQVRRASVNSLGFGGTNAHCILEGYIPSTKKSAFSQSDVLFTPLLFSAASESSLKEMISQHLSFIRANPEIDLRDLAYTLQHRRSTLAYRKFVPAPTVQQTIEALDDIDDAGITFTAVVGHSSGEIGAAYAAGLISDRDAIRIAYFRGVHAKLAANPSPHSPRGAMIAVGTSSDEAKAFCIEHDSGWLQVAAVNSSSSVTLSGDEDTVDEAEQLYKTKGIFGRKLKVDTAYHSMHMTTCAEPYLTSLDGCEIQAIQPPENVTTTLYSSVFEGQPMTSDRLTNQYWVENMCNAVLFSGGLERAVEDSGPFDLAIEVGPHPALNGPATATVDAESNWPYTGLLSCGQDYVYHLSDALGFMWAHLGSDSVQFTAVEQLLSGKTEANTALKGLPPYPFEHQRDYWHNSRLGDQFKSRRAHQLPNPVLGTPCCEATTPGEYQWRNMLQPGEVPWLNGHDLQGQTVFPAMGYASMAVEAINAVILDSKPDSTIRVLKLTDLDIPRAIVFNNDSSTVETIFSILSFNSSDAQVAAEWTCYSVEGSGSVVLNARGRVSAQLAKPEPSTLPLVKDDAFNLVPSGVDHFYSKLSRTRHRSREAITSVASQEPHGKTVSFSTPLAGNGETLSNYEVQLYKDVDRVAYWFARNASLSIPAAERGDLLPHFQNIDKILERYEDRKDVRFV